MRIPFIKRRYSSKSDRSADRRRRRNRVQRRHLVYESLEARHLLAAVIWDGGGGDLRWSNPLNWSTNQLPGPSDDVTIDAPGDVTIVYDVSEPTTINSLILADALRLSAGTIDVQGTFEFSSGRSLTVTGAGVSFVAHAATIIDGASFDVRDGGELALPSAQAYTASNVGSGVMGYFRASGAGSRLDLSSLTELHGTTGWGSFQVTASDGGAIDLQGVTRIDTGSINFSSRGSAAGTASRIILSDLESFASTRGWPTTKASMEAKDSGVLELGNLTVLDDVDLLLNPTADIDTSELVTFTNGTLTASGVPADLRKATDISFSTFVLSGGGSVNLNAATNIDGANFDVRDGSVLALPSAQAYAASNVGTGVMGYFRASGAGSRLDLSSLTELNGTTGHGKSFQVAATAGASIDLQGITRIDAGSINFSANGASEGIASRVVLSQLEAFNSTQGFQTRQASIEATSSGIIELGNLTALNRVDLLLNPTAAINTSELVTFTNGTLTAAAVPADLSKATDISFSTFVLSGGGSVNLNAATNIDGANFDVRDGGVLALPSAHAYTASNDAVGIGYLRASGAGSQLDLSSLTELNGTTRLGRSFQIDATDGGLIGLQGITRIDAGSINFSASGASEGIASRIVLNQLEAFNSTRGFGTTKASMEAKDSGIIELGKLSVLDGVDLLLNPTATIDTSELVAFTNGTLTAAGVPADLSKATDISYSTFVLSSGGSVNLNAATNINGANFDVRDGSVLALPSAQTYAASNVGSGVEGYFRASGAGSRLDLSSLTELHGTSGQGKSFHVAANDGGVIDLQGITRIDAGSINFRANGATADIASRIVLNQLEAFNSTRGFSTAKASMEARNSGIIELAKTSVELSQVDMVIEPSGTIMAASIELGSGATLSGQGELFGNVSNAGGTVVVGKMPNGLKIQGDYTQAASGRLIIAVDGAVHQNEYSRLLVGGVATLAGTLEITRANNFAPDPIDAYPVLAAGTISGTFDFITGGEIAGGDLAPEYGANVVVLSRNFDSDPFDSFDYQNTVANQRVFFDVNHVSGSPVAFRIYDPAGRLVAYSAATPANPDEGDFGPFLLGSVGTYEVRVHSSSGTPVDFSAALNPAPLVTRPAAYQQVFSGEINVPGATDVWEIDAHAGGQIRLNVLEILGADQVLAFRLTDAEGRVVFHHQGTDQSLNDELLSPHVVTTSGLYRLTVEGVGDDTAPYRFVLYNSPAPFVVAFSPLGPQRTDVATMQVRFSQAMDASSFTSNAISILGPNPVEVGPNMLIPSTSVSITPVSDRVFQIDIDPALAVDGKYLVTVGPSIFDLAGIPLTHAHQFAFEIDTNGPRVVAANPGGLVQNHLSFIDVTFDSPIDASTFTAEDISLAGPVGDISIVSIQPLPNDVFRIHFDAQTTSGEYTLRVGPDIADPAGNLMDQNQNGIQGEPEADVFQHLLTISLPDLVAGEINVEGSLMPNTPVTVYWQVENIGVGLASGPWTERVYLADSATGDNRQLLASFNYNRAIAPTDPAVVRSESLTLPSTSFSGDVYFVVEIDATDNVIESDENNLFVSAASYVIPATLSLSFPASQVVEGGPSLQGTITRNGDPSQPLVVTLNSSVADQVVMPATVTIPAGQYSHRFHVSALVDHIADGDVQTLVTASADGFFAASRILDVIDVDRGTLTLSAGVTSITEGDSLVVTVERSGAGLQPLVVSLSTTFTSQWTVPASVLIPANQTTAQFTIQTVDDLRSEKTETVSLTASAAGYDPVQFNMQIVDDDLPVLSIQLSRDSILESDTANPILATVSRETVTGNSVRVRLTSSHSGRAVVPSEVIIPAGQASATFFITPVDNDLFDGTQLVVIRANGLYDSCGCVISTGFGEATVEVLDDESPSLLLETSQTFVREGVSPAGQIAVRRLAASIDVPLAVALSSSNPAKLKLPSTVTIPAGEASVLVAFSTIADEVITGDEEIVVTATAAGLTTAKRTLTVTDIALPDLVVTHVDLPASGLAGETVSIGWTTRNSGQSAASGTWVERVFISTDNAVGDDILVGQYTFTGTLAAQQTYQRVASIELPAIPGEYWLIVQTDATDQIREGLETNNHRVSASPIGIAPAYTATVSAAIETAPADTPVLLTGSATRPDGSPAGNEPVSIHLSVRGTKRILPAMTDAAGNFRLTFHPLPGEGGTYTIGAAQPGIPSAPAQDSFRLIGMRAEPLSEAIRIYEAATPFGGSLTIRNLADVPLTGLSVELLGAPVNLQVTAALAGGATTLASAGTVMLHYTAAATDALVLSGSFDLRISSQEGPAITVPVSFNVVPHASQLVADPGSLSKGMLVGDQTVVEFTISNTGGKETGSLNVLLPTGADWLRLATPASIPSLVPGASTSITLLLTPPVGLELTAYNGSLVVRGDDNQVSIPFSFRAVSETTGDLQVTVVDEYFYFAEDKPLVSTATVTLRDVFTGEVVASSATASAPSAAEGEAPSGVTIDSLGRVTFAGVASGPYTLEIHSANHESYSNTIRVEAGALNERQVFVSRNLVEYVWTVEEIEIEDRTRISIEAVFETNVPAPVVTMQYREAGQTDFQDGVVFDFGDLQFIGNSKQIEIKITNHGLIAANGVAFEFGSHPFYEVTPLVDEIGTLAAKSEVIVPVILRRVADYSSFGEGESASLGLSGNWSEGESVSVHGAIPCSFGAFLKFYYICVDEIWVSTGIALVNYVVETCLPAGGGGAVVAGGGRPGRVTPVSLASSQQCRVCDTPFDNIEIVLMAFIESEAAILYPDLPVRPPPPVLAVPLPNGGYLNPLNVLIGSGDGRSANYFAKDEKAYRAKIELTVNVGSGGAVAGPFYDFGKSNTYIRLSGTPLFNTSWGDKWWVWDLNQGATPLFTQTQTPTPTNIFATVRPIDPFELEVRLVIDAPPPQGIEMLNPNINSDIILRIRQECDSEPVVWLVSGNHDAFPAYELYINQMPFYNYSAFSSGGTPLDLWGIGSKVSILPSATVPVPSLQSRPFTASVNSMAMTSKENEKAACAAITIPANGELEFNSLDTGGVCATVRIHLDQTLVQSRSAVRATLQLNNNSMEDTIEDIDVAIWVTDEFGRSASNVMQVQREYGSDLLVQPNAIGRLQWLITPAEDAASSDEVTYLVGGTMSYLHNGRQVSVDLQPVAVSVMPSPALSLNYFLQRDVISDDPHTDEIEPAEPFTLAVMVRNNGAGDARNLRIESAQPRIIENEKGLLIDFEIIGTKVNGQEMQRSLTANFGTVAAGEISIAEWQMEASLQGLFTEYNATFEHLSPFGDNRFSLIKSVEIHELIRVVDAAQVDGGDGLPDFLVNDLPDPNDLPDTLYLSDGSVMDVGLGSDAVASATPTLENLRIDVTAEMTGGWSYLRMGDPSQGNFILVGVERSDGTAVPAQNFWQTDRTFIGAGQRPRLENRIHLLDYDSTGVYTFIFSNGDTVGPVVVSFAGVSPNPTTQAIDTIEVTFTERLHVATFTESALHFTKNGEAVELVGLSIDAIGDSTYRLHGLAPYTADDAIYELFVDARGVTDLVGNAGTQTQSYRWVKGEAVPTILDVVGAPRGLTTTSVDWIDLVMSKPIDLDALTIGDLSLSRNDVELLDTEVTISQVGDTTYRIGNLGRLTGEDGTYQFFFDAAAIRDLDGRAGLGDAVATWTLDTTPPQLVGVIPPATNPRNIVVQRIDVEFSEAIDIDTLSVDALTLVREGDPENLIAGDSRIFFEHRFDNVYRIHGINWVQGFVADPQVATFTLTVDASGISDLAGNLGSGVQSVSWTIDLDRPEPPADLALATASGPVVSGLVNSLDARISGTLAEPGLTVAVRDMRTGTDLARAVISGTEFDLPITFSSTGQQRLRVRAIDPAGNTSDAFIENLFVTTTPPFIDSIAGIPNVVSSETVDHIDVVLTVPVATGPVTIDSLSLTRNDEELLDDEVTITLLSASTFRIGNLARLMDSDGVYRFTVDSAEIRDVAGNAGSQVITRSWTHDSTPPVSSVSGLPETVNTSHFMVSWSGADGENGAGINHYDVYVSIDDAPFELWLSGVQETSNLFAGWPGRSYAFYSVATDNAGHQEAKAPLTEASTVVFVSDAWQNPIVPVDVNNDGHVSPLDALLIINYLNRRGQNSELPEPAAFAAPYFDVSGDGHVTPLDVLLVINYLNRPERAEGEGLAAVATHVKSVAPNDDLLSTVTEDDRLLATDDVFTALAIDLDTTGSKHLSGRIDHWIESADEEFERTEWQESEAIDELFAELE